MSIQRICDVLQPLFDLGDIRDLNGPAGARLAELIHPRDTRDLTVREVLALLAQIDAEWNAHDIVIQPATRS